MSKSKQKETEAFERLLRIMDRLREECPWDRKQTFDSLRRLTIEETFELAEAITEHNYTEIERELGDLLMHIVFYAKIGEEVKSFDITTILEKISEKLIYRHPHIFGNTKVSDAEEVEKNWEALKLKEKGKKKQTVLGGVPHSLPAMIKAVRIQEKVRGVGFDWDKKEQIWDKINEEINELRDAVKRKNSDDTEKEFGDVFFSLINAARLYGIDPDNALEKTNKKFIKRFNYLETKTIEKGKSLHKMNLDEMNKIWEEAKQFDD
ncbi:MAG TPA: nucleoside triphosphate pyrophosphohydrolase [Bacteroidales bacterium]|nr:nucleoside triphosphate pyrophosphohydrolase [Bacteroidales bacterium]